METESTKIAGVDITLFDQCAGLAAWHAVERDPAQRAFIENEFAQCFSSLVESELMRRADGEGREAKKEREQAKEQSGQEANEQSEREEKERIEKLYEKSNDLAAAQELKREITLEPPSQLTNDPAYQRALAMAKDLQARLVQEQSARRAAEHGAASYQGIANSARIDAYAARSELHQVQEMTLQREQGAGLEAYEADSLELDAEPLQEGLEVEGEILEIANVGGKNYYVIEHDGERVAVPAGRKPEYEAGDEITATRGREGVETELSYGYGR